ncbi:MAG: helix-turn-helix domain-containing protein [Candidatus Altiarchaeota archaeon]|nr:helix-turn-helix domain-containing protein [Candidatus Altiarchaeota archaeon]
MLSDLHKAQILQLRGLGFRKKEIAEKLGVSEAQVNYCLSGLRKLSDEKGVDAAYIEVLVSGFGPETLKFLGELQGLRKVL